MADPFDYSGLEATAQALLESFGRDMVLRVTDDTPADPTKPWLGGSGFTDYPVRGVFDDDTLRRQGGGTTVQGRQALVWIAAATIPEVVDVKLSDSIIDDGKELKTTPDIQTIQPGPVPLLYGFTVEV